MVVIIVPMAMIIMVMVMVMLMLMPMVMLSIVALVAALIFRGANEIHWPIAGVVFTAVLAPVQRMIRRYVQVHRRRGHRVGRWLDQHRLGIQHRRRWTVTELHLSINPGCHLSREYDVEIQFTGARSTSSRCREHGNR